MYVGTQIEPRDDSDYQVWAQLGVTHICVDPPGSPGHWSLDELCRHKEHVDRSACRSTWCNCQFPRVQWRHRTGRTS